MMDVKFRFHDIQEEEPKSDGDYLVASFDKDTKILFYVATIHFVIGAGWNVYRHSLNHPIDFQSGYFGESARTYWAELPEMESSESEAEDGEETVERVYR